MHIKLMALPAKLLNYISCPRVSAALCLQLCARAWMSHDPAQLVFLRDEEESVSPLLFDTSDDWNINGLCRAEHQQRLVPFIREDVVLQY